ncbi:MAG: hypothetical protein ACHQ4H_04135 [Ktedonobacterales bacterium]
MTTDMTCDREATLIERRAAFEMAVVNALLDESASEREERLGMVRLAREMTLQVLLLSDFEDESLDN